MVKFPTSRFMLLPASTILSMFRALESMTALTRTHMSFCLPFWYYDFLFIVERRETHPHSVKSVPIRISVLYTTVSLTKLFFHLPTWIFRCSALARPCWASRTRIEQYKRNLNNIMPAIKHRSAFLYSIMLYTSKTLYNNLGSRLLTNGI